ncbi:MAG TPA: hypothetical protein VHV30_08600 [Polyangiaceae bacterium]|jgi:hypothetical protein|nr:hypothetical protein [Polyangiaceae bacterium]
MNGLEKAWPAQEPPADFASRTVAAVLADRAEARAKRPARRRLVVACAMAAVMVAGVAWGLTTWRDRTVTKARTTAESPVLVREAASTPPPAFAPPSVEEDAAVAAPPPAPRAAPRPRKRSESAPDAGRKVFLPPCDCSPHDELCTCL